MVARYLPSAAPDRAVPAPEPPEPSPVEESDTPEDATRWGTLVDRLRAECVPEWEQARKGLYISRIVALADKVAGLAEAHGAPRFTRWARELRHQADTFDISRIPATLQAFESLLADHAARAGRP